METHYPAMEISQKEAQALGYLFSKPDLANELGAFIEGYGDIIRQVTEDNMDTPPKELAFKIADEVSKVIENE